MTQILISIFFLSSISFLRADEQDIRSLPSHPSHRMARSDEERTSVQEDGKTVLYKRRTQVEFDGTLIEGEVKNPNEFYFVYRPEQKFGKLVKRREQFHKEMLRDTVMMR